MSSSSSISDSDDGVVQRRASATTVRKPPFLINGQRANPITPRKRTARKSFQPLSDLIYPRPAGARRVGWGHTVPNKKSYAEDSSSSSDCDSNVSAPSSLPNKTSKEAKNDRSSDSDIDSCSEDELSVAKYSQENLPVGCRIMVKNGAKSGMCHEATVLEHTGPDKLKIKWESTRQTITISLKTVRNKVDDMMSSGRPKRRRKQTDRFVEMKAQHQAYKKVRIKPSSDCRDPANPQPPESTVRRGKKQPKISTKTDSKPSRARSQVQAAATVANNTLSQEASDPGEAIQREPISETPDSHNSEATFEYPQNDGAKSPGQAAATAADNSLSQEASNPDVARPREPISETPDSHNSEAAFEYPQIDGAKSPVQAAAADNSLSQAASNPDEAIPREPISETPESLRPDATFAHQQKGSYIKNLIRNMRFDYVIPFNPSSDGDDDQSQLSAGVLSQAEEAESLPEGFEGRETEAFRGFQL